MVRSWSFPGKEDGNGALELEESTAAEEYFSISSQDTMSVVEEILTELVDSVVILSGDVEEDSPEKPKERRKLRYQPTMTSGSSHIEHLHSHMLLYCGRYDAEHILYVFQTLRNIFITNPRIFLSATATNGLVPRSPLLKLLACHRKSLFGRGFSGDLEPGSLRRSMYIEVVLAICLYYIRSYYPNLGENVLTPDDISLNREVQISATEILTLICSEMVTLVRDSGRALACYLAHLFSRLKVYKIILHCALTSVHPCKTGSSNLTHQVLNFNEGLDATKDRLSRHSEILQIHFVRLLLSLIILEHEINIRKDDEALTAERSGDGNELKYDNGKSIPQQHLFITAITRALELHPYARHTQSQWTTLITCSLPYLGSALTKVVTTVVRQICNNIEALSKCYTDPASVSFPPDYGITQIEALTILCHYCLLDSPFNQTISFPSPLSSRIFNNFSSVVLTSPPATEPNKEKPESHCSARKAVLGNLPRVIASVAVLWQALVNRKDREGENCEVGSPRVVKQQLLDFLSPVAKHHAVSFLAAMAVVWRERRPASTPHSYTAISTINEDQQVLVQILSGIKAMPIDTLVKTLHQVVKQPAMNQEIAVSVEVSALELFVQYSQLFTGSILLDSWTSLLPLFKEAPSLSPPAQFLLLGALSQFVHKSPSFTDKKVLKDLQDITAKLLESCTTTAGACLEQTTWLRRNLAVREEEPPVTPDREDKYFENDAETPENDSSIPDESLLEGKPKKARKSKLKRVTKKIRHDAEKLQIRALHQWFMKAFVNETNLPLDLTENTKNGGTSIAQYSVGALTILAHLLAPLFDVVFGSQEKERVVVLLTNLMYNVTPYLKNHTQRNSTSYFACSQLLASLSGYQYTRKAWKKDALELLWDSSFFQMEPRCIPYWKTIVDNLFSQEAGTFRELLVRVSTAQGNSLSIFSSKEQEYEQRAQLIKRLAFVILCSEKDQFHKYVPDIQDRLADCWRMPQVVPTLQAQIFLCFRVLLLRMSPHHIVPFWPPIISELVQVLMHMELDLSTSSEEFRRVLSSMDSGWIQNSSNGMQASSNPQWLQLQLAAASFLFLAVQLPADNHPQFQMYRWAFVGGDLSSNRSQGNVPDFIPHVTRIARLMDAKFGTLEALPTPLLPSCGQIRSVEELHPFFTAMSTGRYTPLSLSQLEHNTELDFLDIMPPR
ncbi:hypothetical protein AAG570_003679 [Ranatra chinensis]|uniref:Uncharacterized protein n=1 Tax=Ranatra chinensis TaxID=642074 RepID=A0ABD0Y5I7_9HEMI